MKTAIRKHRRDFLAIVGLLVLAVFVSSIILSHERLTLPSWVPVLGKDFYVIKGEFSTAQAVTPGQGQTVDVAGVKVGEISSVDLVGGRAVITMKLDTGPDTITVHRDATMLLRPKTGLKDMVVELDPGSQNAPALPENGTIPVSQTAPDVNLDELLSSLDDDSRTYLQALLSAGATGLDKRGKDLGDAIRAFKPTARALSQINGALATRRANIKRVIHNFSLLAGELGSKDAELARFVDDSNAVLAVLAGQGSSIRATLRGLPGALSDTQSALGKTRDLATQLGPALQALRPAARQLGPTLQQVRPFLRDTTPVIRDSVRPLVREARPLVAELRPTMRNLSAATPDLLATLKIVNTALDALAYNPPGQEEGYLFWFAWVNHLGASIFSTQDAHGVVRRGLILASCQTLGILDNIKNVNPLLGTIISLSNFPQTSVVCDQQQTRKAGAG
jgi:phospholipid/cholesterol/gamma-HCH transport system substrate-binding protein